MIRFTGKMNAVLTAFAGKGITAENEG